jgi:hypothetical protein
VESILADLDSLVLYAGVHQKHSGFHRMLASRFPFAIYDKKEDDAVYVYAILEIYVGIRLGSVRSWNRGRSRFL